MVLTVRSVSASVAFYSNILGMTAKVQANGRTALHFGRSKINLHQAPSDVEPRARNATEGSADFCLTTSLTPTQLGDHLRTTAAELLLGPVVRAGARGEMTSFYLRDPDGNLVEIATYVR